MSQIIDTLLETAKTHRPLTELLAARLGSSTVGVDTLCGSAFAFYAAGVIKSVGGIHIFVSDDKDAAAYLCNDLYTLLGQDRVLFFPSSYKRSIQFGGEDSSGLVQRTAAMAAIKDFSESYLVVCTYPEAMIERVVDMEALRRDSLKIARGERLTIDFLQQVLAEYGFAKVDFVYDPGQYSVRGGIVDIFSYSMNRPVRIDLFGDEVDTIRIFDIASQLSAERVESVEIVPDFKKQDEHKVSFARFAGTVDYWFEDLDFAMSRFDEIRKKLLGELDEPSQIDRYVTGSREFMLDSGECRMIQRKASQLRRPPERSVLFDTLPQPLFNKQYQLLADDIEQHNSDGYTTYILSDNRVQVERLQNIFTSIGKKNLNFHAIAATLHEGFIDRDLQTCLYADHMIFERYHRYAIRGGIDRSQSLTVAELNELKVGDYVVHIDHGVGRFGGLVRTTENGKMHEAIKIVYRDNDVLLVNVHALHRVARYKDKDSDTPPKIYKLGSGAWQRLKTATKSAVKSIARELIALYAERKASEGYAFEPDGYLQQELEASFEWEETPDQQKAMDSVRSDMESAQPMDRLICGDVGFGKTEVAIRAAFKAVSNSKQVAVLVPTTILSLQHFRTFSHRLANFPVKIENLSRAQSAKETRRILAELADGKVDIIIGTHKILGNEVHFKDLGLLIIDEEQKFGVTSKERLRRMRVNVDTLTMTATPIPRTLQFSLMGSRDLSVIATPPPNRQPIVTEQYVFDREIIREAIDFELTRGGQVYFVHNKVDDLMRIEGLVRELSPKARVVTAHGQMNSADMEKRVMEFIYGEYDVLISTTIIENGIDIPNANTIIIDNAQNFGLSDLHQLRGRVGRSDAKGYCYLLIPSQEMLTSDARRRLRAIEEFSELGAGFNIAMQDLDIRGAGNLLGAEQSGFIADMGFETYRKILSEAVDELRAEGAADIEEIAPEQENQRQQINYISDCQIETDVEAILPDSYITQSSEKLRLYRQLDETTTEESLQSFTSMLVDRFGPLPQPAVELLEIVRIRWTAIRLGFEWVKVKNGLMLLRFVSNASSPYFKSGLFMDILQYAASQSGKIIIKQNNNTPFLTVRNIQDLTQARQTLTQMAEHVGA